MRYNFKNILDEELYNNTRVILITGKYQLFNNLIADTLKDMSIDKNMPNSSLINLGDEFGVSDEEASASTSVDIDTFFDVANVSNINGKWFCRVELGSMTKKQKENFIKYAKQPSRYGILVVISTNYADYREFLNNKIFTFGQYTHIMSLSFPNRLIMKNIVQMMFADKGYEIDNQSIDYFIMRMSSEYDKYEEVINKITEQHNESGETKNIEYSDIKNYMRGIEYFDIDDFMYELVKPLSSGKTNNKKIIRMLASLKDKYESEKLVIELQKKIAELLDFRIMINSGYISINVRYIFNDVVKLLGDNNKYAKMNEWVFRKKADLASMTSLQDWTCMNIILNKALAIGYPDSKERKMACEKALYELVTRSTYTESRINNILGLDNVLNKQMNRINRVTYKENK